MQKIFIKYPIAQLNNLLKNKYEDFEQLIYNMDLLLRLKIKLSIKNKYIFILVDNIRFQINLIKK